MRYTYRNSEAIYVCINKGEAQTIREIADRSVCIDDDIHTILYTLLQ